MSVSNLADELGMSGPPCWRRVKRLKDAGILARKSWLVDPALVGLNVIVFATIRLTTHDEGVTIAFRAKVLELPEVLECYILLGTFDALIKIAAGDMKAYEAFYYNTLSRMPSVRETTLSVVMSEIKNTNILPIP